MSLRTHLAGSAAILGVLALAACDSRPGSEPAPGPTADTPPSLAVPPSQPAPLPAPSPRSAAIQTQDGPDGTRVSLTRAQVTGSVLTVQLSYDRPAEGSAGIRYAAEEVAVIDDATAQRYGVLRDQTGRWQASPLQSPTSDYLLLSARPGDPAVVWFKFPAPAPGSTISINVPEVGPFDGVTVQR